MISPDEVRVWVCATDALDDRDASRLLALLSDDERASWEKFRVAADRAAYLVAHALARRCLSWCADVEPAAWTFTVNEHGRPDIAPGHTPLDLRFNLSHTRGLVACAVCVGREVGVDVEGMQRDRQTVAVADRFFAPAEVAALRAAPDGAQRAQFFRYWTLKEAYIKARGMGLALPLGKFAFDLDAEPIAVAFDPGLRDDPASWQFDQMPIGDAHMLALAVRAGRGRRLAVKLKRLQPESLC